MSVAFGVAAVATQYMDCWEVDGAMSQVGRTSTLNGKNFCNAVLVETLLQHPDAAWLMHHVRINAQHRDSSSSEKALLSAEQPLLETQEHSVNLKQQFSVVDFLTIQHHKGGLCRVIRAASSV